MPDVGDKYVWRVALDDGSAVEEFDADGTEHGWAEVPKGRVVAAALLPRVEGYRPVGVVIDPASGQRPVVKKPRHISVPLGPEGPVGEETHTVLASVVGWEREVGGETVRSLCYCLDDGRVILSDRDLV